MQKSRQKRNLIAFSTALMLLVFACFFSVLGESFAWYGGLKDTTVTINGSVTYVARYFESGNGKSSTEVADTINGVYTLAGITLEEYETQYQSGMVDSAYEIKTPAQFYNLAWLQYMGYFNPSDEQGAENDIECVYFYLSADLDMTGYTLPPIGTTAHPFIGSFNGNGHTISNLTVENIKANMTGEKSEMPLQAIEEMAAHGFEELQDIEIIGLFGVIGSYNGSATFEHQTPSVTDVVIKDIMISSQTNDALAGLAAGYVNGSVTGVAVDGGQITTNKTPNAIAVTKSAISSTGSSIVDTNSDFSRYSLVGFATEDYVDEIKICEVAHSVEVKTGNFEASRAGDAWGGSLDMEDLYNRLGTVYNSVRTNSSNYARYYTQAVKTVDIEENVSIVYDETTSVAGSVYYTNYNNWNGYLNYNWDGYAKYSFPRYNDNKNPSTYGYNIVYGSGGDQGVNNALTITTHTTSSQPAFTIMNEGFYLNVTSGAFGPELTGAVVAQPTRWVISDVEGGGTVICTVINGETYHLYFNGSSLSLSTNQSTVWTKTQNPGGTFTFSYNGYYLNYGTASGTWQVTKLKRRFYVSNNSGTTYYMYATGNNSYAQRTTSKNYQWVLDEEGYLYTVYNGSTYYLGSYYYWFTYYARTYTSKGNASTWSIDSSNRIYTYVNGTPYYLYYYNSSTSPWRLSTSTGNVNTILVDHIVDKPCTISSTGSHMVVTVISQAAPVFSPYITNDSVFPIMVGTQSGVVYETDPKNTGYFVGGTDAGETLGNLRIAQYPMSALAYSLNGNPSGTTTYADQKFEILTRTASSGGFVRISDDYNAENTPANTADQIERFSNNTKTHYSELGLTKYEAARAALAGKTPAPTNIYGIHFMDDSISIDNTLTIPQAYINGTLYTNYQLPRNCIDFNLKSAGKIDFFAHTGFVNRHNTSQGYTQSNINWNNTNNTFFSLHQIYRDDNLAITAIKEISEVYECDVQHIPYIYKYTDGTYSCLSVTMDENGNFIYTYSTPTGSPNVTPGAMVFDTAWITNPGIEDADAMFSAYYFEIPANPGEYALGSVEGKNGGYLFYLDISANAQTVMRTITTETIVSTTSAYEFPKGVDFATSAAIVNDASATITLPANESGTVNYGRTGNNITATTSGGFNLSSTYIEDGLTINSGDITAVPRWTNVVVKTIETISDFNITTEQTTWRKTVTEHDGSGNQIGDPVVTHSAVQIEEKNYADLNEQETPITSGTPVVSYSYVLPEEAAVTIDSTYTYRNFDNYSTTKTCTIVNTEDISMGITGGSTTVKHFVIGDGTTGNYYEGKVTVNAISVDGDSEIELIPPAPAPAAKRFLSFAMRSIPVQPEMKSPGLYSTYNPYNTTVLYNTDYEAVQPDNHELNAVHDLVIPEANVVTYHYPDQNSASGFGKEICPEQEHKELHWLPEEGNAAILARSSALAGYAGGEIPAGLIALRIPADTIGIINWELAGEAEPVFALSDGTIRTSKEFIDDEGNVFIDDLIMKEIAWSIDTDKDGEPEYYNLVLASDGLPDDGSEPAVLNSISFYYDSEDTVVIAFTPMAEGSAESDEKATDAALKSITDGAINSSTDAAVESTTNSAIENESGTATENTTDSAIDSSTGALDKNTNDKTVGTGGGTTAEDKTESSVTESALQSSTGTATEKTDDKTLKTGSGAAEENTTDSAKASGIDASLKTESLPDITLPYDSTTSLPTDSSLKSSEEAAIADDDNN